MIRLSSTNANLKAMDSAPAGGGENSRTIRSVMARALFQARVAKLLSDSIESAYLIRTFRPRYLE